jgi:flavin-dependent dehydrogenase
MRPVRMQLPPGDTVVLAGAPMLKQSRTSDALIVGGGPAGLAAAIALRQKGMNVLVVDALRPPIDKACGEGLMPDAQCELARLGIAVSRSDGAVFEGIAFVSERARATAPFADGCGIGIRRLHLHSLLVERANQLGVRIAWGGRVQLSSHQPVLLDGGKCVYRYLIGADGQSSRVRSWSGLGRARLFSQRFGSRRHFRVKPWSRMVEVHWGSLGQAYVTPIAIDEVCVATVARSASSRIEDVLVGLPLLRQQLDGAAAVSPVRGALTTTRKQHRVTRANVALAGDAAGSVDAVTGEGLALAFRQGLLLAEAIDQDNLAVYEAGHAAILRRPQIMSKAMLSMDRWSWLRDRALAAFAREPHLFAGMLAAHLGEQSLSTLLVRDGMHLGWRLLMPLSDFR